MGRGHASRTVVVGLAGLLALASSARGEEAKPAPCTLDPGPTRTVARVLDAETLSLDDGSIVRLIGALAPRARDAGAAPGAWPPESEAVNALSDLVLGKKVMLAFGGRRTDRYGHFLAHVFLVEGGGNDWVQGEMLDSGHARVYGLPDSFACSRELLAHEVEARRNRLGLWSNGIYRPVPASHPDWLMTLRGKFERVIGTVKSVGRTKSATYLNFGSDYHTDFTARIGKTVLAASPDFSQGLEALATKTIVVRGWIDRNNGPMIDVADPSQVEVVDERADPDAVSAKMAPSTVSPAKAPAQSVAPKEARPAPPEGAEPGAVNL